jgi:ribonuclease III
MKDEKLAELEGLLQIEFNDRTLLERALTHRSFLNENPAITRDNERLEFLGDALLDFVVGDYLFTHFPDMAEGELTALRAALVRAPTLAEFAHQLEIGRFLRLGYGEDESGGRQRIPLLCATFEAVVGAIYLDQGLPPTRHLIERLIKPTLVQILAQALHKDAKSEFQVWAQAQFNLTPHYRVTSISGPDHAREFTMQVLVGEVIWGAGSGRSKQAAAQEAARSALIQAAAYDETDPDLI